MRTENVSCEIAAIPQTFTGLGDFLRFFGFPTLAQRVEYVLLDALTCVCRRLAYLLAFFFRRADHNIVPASVVFYVCPDLGGGRWHVISPLLYITTSEHIRQRVKLPVLTVNVCATLPLEHMR